MRFFVYAVILFLPLIFLTNCSNIIKFKPSALVDTLNISTEYGETPADLRSEYDRRLEDFVFQYNLGKQNYFKLRLNDTIVDNRLIFRFRENHLVNSNNQITGYWLTTLGIAVPVILNASGVVVPFIFIFIPQNKSRIQTKLSTDIAKKNFEKMNFNIITNGFFGSHQRQILKQGKKFERILKIKFFELEEDYYYRSNDSVAKNIISRKTLNSVRFGLVTGFTFNAFKSSAGFAPNGFTNSGIVKGYIGISANYVINRNISLETDLIFSGRGGSAYQKNDSIVLRNIFTGTTQEVYNYRHVNLNYIELPMVVKFGFINRRIVPYIKAGLAPGMVTKADVKYNYFVDYEQQWKSEPIEGIKKFDLGILYGGGMDIKLGIKTRIGIEYLKKAGLTHTLDSQRPTQINSSYMGITLNRRF